MIATIWVAVPTEIRPSIMTLFEYKNFSARYQRERYKITL